MRSGGIGRLVASFVLFGTGILLIEVDVGPRLALSALGVAAFGGYILLAGFWLLSPRRLGDKGPDWVPQEEQDQPRDAVARPPTARREAR